MNEIMQVQNNIAQVDPTQIYEIFKQIQERHKRVSQIETPKSEIKKDFSGNEYVEESYMRRIADKNYPGWSFIIIDRMTHPIPFKTQDQIYVNQDKKIGDNYMKLGSIFTIKEAFEGLAEIAKDSQNNEVKLNAINTLLDLTRGQNLEGVDGEIEIAFSVHGRLMWYEDGILRQGDMVAGHQNLMLKDKSGYVSVSNAWKSAVTECKKKAFNAYMNIADDVYRNIDVELSEDVRAELLNIIRPIDDAWLSEIHNTSVEEINELILNGTVNANNLKATRKKLEKYRAGWDLESNSDK